MPAWLGVRGGTGPRRRRDHIILTSESTIHDVPYSWELKTRLVSYTRPLKCAQYLIRVLRSTHFLNSMETADSFVLSRTDSRGVTDPSLIAPASPTFWNNHGVTHFSESFPDTRTAWIPAQKHRSMSHFAVVNAKGTLPPVNWVIVEKGRFFAAAQQPTDLTESRAK